MDWFLDLTSEPITIAELKRQVKHLPRGPVCRIAKNRSLAEKLINDLQNGESSVGDIVDLINREIEPTTKLALIKARLGQGQFRTQVLQLWDNHCAVSGSITTEAIRASHIKPWKVSTDLERLDPQNGLPLTANLDALFDRGLISFESSGQMIVSPQLSGSERKLLQLNQQKLSKSPTPETAAYLAHHRERFFGK